MINRRLLRKREDIRKEMGTEQEHGKGKVEANKEGRKERSLNWADNMWGDIDFQNGHAARSRGCGYRFFC